ncbi:MAG: pyruvate formate lyase family protein [Dehalococcoidia bacterium]|nr:pyruvate formate lyase family protein [Dehalococcoidia bacterium]
MTTTIVKERGMTDRVRRLKDSLALTEGRVSCERLHFLKEAYEETECEPPPIRVARSYEKYLCGMTLYIDENPIVGSLTKYKGGFLPFPEFSCDWMIKEVEIPTYGGKLRISEEDRVLLKEAVDYWWNKCKMYKAKEAFSKKYGVDGEELYHTGVFSSQMMVAYGRLNMDYARVLNKGLEGIIAEAEEELDKIPIGCQEAYRKGAFLKAIIIACNAVIKFSRRYAALAREMAQKEESPEKRRELEKIAETCDWVPAKPARTFYEAVQSFWFTHLAGELEDTAGGRSPGRFAMYMYPFYKRDKEAGRITEEEAIELIELLFIKFAEITRFLPESFFGHTMGAMMQNISLGGVTAAGADATNEMDYLILEAQRRVQMPQPTLSILSHNSLPQDFLLKGLEVVRTGIGMPAFFNNDVTIQRLLDHGATLKDARNCALIGCVEGAFSHCAGSLRGVGFNSAKMLELALNNGKDPKTGEQWGPQTGDPLKFKSYEELCDAVREQFKYFVLLHTEFENVATAISTEFFPKIFTSALVDDCMEKGKDLNSGGARYMMNGDAPVGTIDLADSMAAIKKLVFEKKSLPMGQLLEALEADFKGYEEIQKMLIDAPKYGNDDDYVDQIAKDWYEAYYQEHQKYTDHIGCVRRPMALSVSFHFPLGVRTGALPSGRKANMPLVDGSVSPEPGMDKKGPTALIRSATKILDCVKWAANLLNMKFHPSTLESREAQLKLLAMVRAYMGLGGHHVQFNVVSGDTLRDAQLHPENYRHLIVRVAGFSAYFIHLDHVVQNEIIKRSEIKFA